MSTSSTQSHDTAGVERVIAEQHLDEGPTRRINTFTEASVSLGARLILAYPSWTQMQDYPVITPPQIEDDWNIVSVVQRTCDVRMEINMPYYDPPTHNPNPRFIPFELKCSIYYDPTTDSCMLLSTTSHTIIVSHALAEEKFHLRYGATLTTRPGLWSLSVEATQEPEIHMLDFMILERKFSIDVHPEYASSSKRKIHEDESGSIKRRRGSGQTQIILSTANKHVANSSQNRSLDLKENHVAIISSNEPNGANYEIHHVRQIATTNSAQVFLANHSELPGNVVAKVMKYNGDSDEPTRLIRCADEWSREMNFLSKLKHKNIIKLQGFDGRYFTLYLESLPPALHTLRGTLTQDDLVAIINGISSALAYLEKEGVVHNDIKPANITYSSGRGAVLLDFGLATKCDEKPTGGGTPQFIPPEFQTSGQRTSTGDVWALGITVLYLLGKLRFFGQTWAIHQVRTRSSEASKMMVRWLNLVAAERMKLDRDDKVERLVYLMLEEDPNLRIRAEEVQLGGIKGT